MKRIILALILFLFSSLAVYHGLASKDKIEGIRDFSRTSISFDGGVDYGRPPIPPIKISYL